MEIKEFAKLFNEIKVELTARQLEIGKLRATGASFNEIARALGVSQQNVTQILKAIENKFKKNEKHIQGDS